ncbi:CAP domain-containing protein [uncultured Cellulomonas sp.]|uniref:CAP domain-containing protein n=1 Tax=uncultured Cellulomonas sp. TaxID=189682 RepID=UPI0028E6B81F|nr:CAP domain-containing protein [uncultured Cellulomonas sp.]
MASRGSAGWVLVVAGVLLAGVAVFLLVRPDALEPWSPDDSDPQAYAAELVAETNAAREAEDLEPLAVSECATDQAADRATALEGGKDLEHASLTPVIEACAPASSAAENLSRAGATAHDVVEAWLGSPGHRANLLDPELEQLGIGCLLDDEQMLCSQVFLGP